MCRDHLGYYDALGLEPGAADLPAIKEAFRQAALIWHPDKQKVGILFPRYGFHSSFHSPHSLVLLVAAAYQP